MSKIMVVDDEAYISTQLEERLTSMDYEVVGTASSGEGAISMAKSLSPDLVLMDIVMPGKLDGIEASEIITKELDIPVIFLTAYADDKFLERAKKVQSFGYILKPFQEKEIKANIELALYRKDKERLLLFEELVQKRTANLNKINKKLQLEIKNRKRAQKELRKSEERFRALTERTSDWIWEIDVDGVYTYASPKVNDLLGYKPEEIIGKTPFDFMPADEAERVAGLFREIVKSGKSFSGLENMNIRKDGQHVVLETSGVLFFDKDGTVLGYRGIDRDITECRCAEKKLKSSLREKEVLLTEIHHRVKNNMQIISSLLDMMIMRTQNQEALDLLENARVKIYTMALIHSQLYRSDKFDQINMNTHVREIVNYLMSINIHKDISIKPVVDCSDIYLTVNQAIPCALVINELIFNSLKHAFKGRKKGKIEVFLKKSSEAMALLKVQDDGIGIPEEIDIFKTKTLGLKLVKNIVNNQLNGKIRVDRGIGTTFIIEFKILE